jgi:predicted component of type VI protein secretion system
MADADDRLLEARSDVYWAKHHLAKAEDKSEGNEAGWSATLDKLKADLARAEARLAHLKAKRDVAFGGIK